MYKYPLITNPKIVTACKCVKNQNSPAAGISYVPNVRPKLFGGAGIGQHALCPQARGEGEAGDGRLLGRVHVAAALGNGGRGGQAVRRVRIPANNSYTSW